MLSTNGCVVIGVSVLISVTADISPTGELLVTPIFRWGEAVLSLLRRSCVLPWPGTMPGAAHPKTRGSMIHSPDVRCVSAMNLACPPKAQSSVARGSQADHIEQALLFERKN